MWGHLLGAGGILTGNGWLIFGGLGLLVTFASTGFGMRVMTGLCQLILGVMGLAATLSVLGFATLVILAMTGSL